ncbi:FmdB family zinc ribbon protein [Zhaonella formicivorans]|uniref:FmdB family zinc ribbon protein n=1 Tax=Zhaonella formicivorans TaxID=2528593 RepID=UPI0010CEBC65|nr:FmdB family zinc ribbon protein [Zhaonella formicivorans]
MPTYEYKCEKCGVFDYFQSIKEDALTVCPQCGSAVKRLLSRNVNVIYKGSGFYTTEYRSSEYKSKAGEEKSSGTTAAAAAAE